MTSEDDGLTALSGWTDDEIRADDVRAAGVLYAAATLEELKLIELVEQLNELNQSKLLSIGAGEASNLLHVFWDRATSACRAAPPRGAVRPRPRHARRRRRRSRPTREFAGALRGPRHGHRRRPVGGRRAGRRRAARRTSPSTPTRRHEGRRRAARDDHRDRRRAVGPRAAHRLRGGRHVELVEKVLEETAAAPASRAPARSRSAARPSCARYPSCATTPPRATTSSRPRSSGCRPTLPRSATPRRLRGIDLRDVERRGADAAARPGAPGRPCIARSERRRRDRARAGAPQHGCAVTAAATARSGSPARASLPVAPMD